MTRAYPIARFAVIGAATALLWSPPSTAADRNDLGSTVEIVVAFARRLNPTVAAASLDFDAATHRIGTAGVMADPRFILEAYDVNRQGVGQHRIGFDQEIELWGKYGLERDIARSDADAAKFQGRATVVELVAQVVAAHGEYNAAHEAIGIATDIKRRYDEILGFLRSRYGTTSVDQQDVIKADIEAATAEGDLVRRQGELKSAAARLNALIGRPSMAPMGAPTGFRILKAVGFPQAQALGRSANPMLALAGALSNSAAQTKSLTDLNYYPDVNVGAKYVQRPGTEDTGEFTLGVKLPLHYDVKDAEQCVAGARLGAAQACSEALRLRIDGQITDTWFGVAALRAVVQIYASRQLPPALSSVDNARNGFQAGSSDLSSVFESEQMYRAVELDLLKLKVELQSKYAELERLAGGPL